MAVTISKAESWEKIHEAFSQVNFNSFDYATIKQSLLEYIKLYHSETFNDMIESSEFIAILELFSYVAELAAYRIDMNAHENFLSTASRKESILRLAKFISYKPSRNIPARGLVKVTSVSTSEAVYDSVGRNLANVRVIWNDPNNANWKEHFILVINKVLEQPFGSVAPTERKQFENVLFELYSLDTNPIVSGGKSIMSYTATAAGQSFPMEVVPVKLTDNGPEEKRPETNSKFTMMYGNDGLGDSSDLTGFMFFTKQGTLQKVQTTFDGVTPNQIFEIKVNNINETDVWINNVDPNTRDVLVNDPYTNILPHLVSADTRYGEWFEVDISNAQNIIFNTNKNRRKYEIETLDNDNIKIIFGDGEFADIPSGSFDIWYRTSANDNNTIPKSSIVDQRSSFTYTDSNTQTQTFTFSFSLVSSLQNASASEELEHIRKVSPSVYYTQDRMVNGRDYNSFMLKDPTISKLMAINRTFAGDSKYISWHDPREAYENVKIFGDDLALYWDENAPEDGTVTTIEQPLNGEQMIVNYIEPLLSSTDFFTIVSTQSNTIVSTPTRKFFTAPENATISTALDNLVITTSTTPVNIFYNPLTDVFDITLNDVVNDIHIFAIQAMFDGFDHVGWILNQRTKKLVAHSSKTKFWNTNTITSVVNYDSINSVKDNITILKANSNGTQSNILQSNIVFPVLGQYLLDYPISDIGLPDINRLSVIPADITDDGVPDNMEQQELMKAVFGTFVDGTTNHKAINAVDPTAFIDAGEVVIKLPNSLNYVEGFLNDEVEIFIDPTPINPASLSTYNKIVLSEFESVPSTSPLKNEIKLIGVSSLAAGIIIKHKNYVYMTRPTTDSTWSPMPTTNESRILFANDLSLTENNKLYTRHEGRYPLNFGWFHYVQQYNLVDPAASNIIDIFIITKGYYKDMQLWANNQLDVRPTKPSSLSLRNSYSKLLDNAMISDTVILHSADFRILFGSKALPELQCKFNVIRPTITKLTDNELKVKIVQIVRSYFDIDNWDFGQTFYFTQLSSTIQNQLSTEIDSIIIVPLNTQQSFGDMFQISARENELFLPDIDTDDIEIVQAFTRENMRQN